MWRASKSFGSIVGGRKKFNFYHQAICKISSSPSQVALSPAKPQISGIIAQQQSEVENNTLFDLEIVHKNPWEVTNLAEKLLGPDRFSTRTSLSANFGRFQEIINLFLLKVASIDHPLLQMTKIVEAEQNFLYDDQTSINPFPCWRSMIVLLCTEMFGLSDEAKSSSKDVYNFMIDRHNRVASIAEISHISQILHSKVLDVKDCVSASTLKRISEKNKYLDQMHSANKAAILIGDLLLSQKCVHMAALKSPIATEIICTTLSDYCEGTFELDLDSSWFDNYQSQVLYTPWLKRTQLGQGTILGNMIYLNLHFSGCDSQTRNMGSRIGQLLGTMLQARSDIEFFENQEKLEGPSWLNLSLLPVVIKVAKDPSILQAEHCEIFEKVKGDREVMELSLELFQQYQKASLGFLNEELHEIKSMNVPARNLLCDFIRSLTLI